MYFTKKNEFLHKRKAKVCWTLMFCQRIILETYSIHSKLRCLLLLFSWTWTSEAPVNVARFLVDFIGSLSLA